MSAIHEHCLNAAGTLSPELAEALRRLGPLQLPCDDSQPLAERLARSVAGQQLSVKAAGTIWSRVCAAAGEDPLLDFLHPRNETALRGCGLSGAKTVAVCTIAQEARENGLTREALSGLDASERARRLVAIKGVGPWTADMVNLFYFGEEDIWPEGDVTARKTLTSLTSPRRKTVRSAERFAPYRSYLALYMWRWVDARPD